MKQGVVSLLYTNARAHSRQICTSLSSMDHLSRNVHILGLHMPFGEVPRRGHHLRQHTFTDVHAHPAPSLGTRSSAVSQSTLSPFQNPTTSHIFPTRPRVGDGTLFVLQSGAGATLDMDRASERTACSRVNCVQDIVVLDGTAGAGGMAPPAVLGPLLG